LGIVVERQRHLEKSFVIVNASASVMEDFLHWDVSLHRPTISQGQRHVEIRVLGLEEVAADYSHHVGAEAWSGSEVHLLVVI